MTIVHGRKHVAAGLQQVVNVFWIETAFPLQNYYIL